MKEVVAAILIVLVVTVIRSVFLWACWNWFGFQVLNDAIPTLHAQAIDVWAALGLGTLGTALTAQTDTSRKN